MGWVLMFENFKADTHILTLRLTETDTLSKIKD